MTKNKEGNDRRIGVDTVPLTQCIAWAHRKNPKEHDIDALMASFRRFGFTAPPTIDERSKVMVAGHGRCEALHRMKAAGERPPDGIVVDQRTGDWLVPLLRGVAFRDDRERDAYLIADNQHVIAGQWNLESLTEMLGSFGTDVDAFSGLGFDLTDLRTLGMAVAEDLAAAAGDDDKGKVREHERKKSKAKGRSNELNYRVIVACRDEKHQAELMERLEAEGLSVSPLIS